ncbi:helix-turn-helix domain-containing protein [Burkholderia vietnamiensis]|uniref:helix-turn-helix domain-containing protein n=2 Tax=Burkholderia cepacia complex TaxID=87882 RepID=UPI001CF2FDDE|nr:helix-turn-helix transcriptional regulator [Burkholderia vietnamiensis]MCA8447546.1 helix-turn-helix domain-containing protein [Burkholderia vietnamiensis]
MTQNENKPAAAPIETCPVCHAKPGQWQCPKSTNNLYNAPPDAACRAAPAPSLADEARATIMDACQSISRSADALKDCHTVDGDWGDDLDAKAFYDAELQLLARLTALLDQPGRPVPRAEVTEEQPSLTNPLTPYGMLVRALRIVSGTTLMDMAEHLGRGPAELSAIEFGRKPVRDADIVDAAHFFACAGIQSTTHALTIAARAGGQHADQA